MLVCIPTSINQRIPAEVLQGLKDQSIPIELAVVASPGEPNSHRNPSSARQAGEPRSRNLCRRLAISMRERFAVMQDRDTIHLLHGNIEAMLNFLEKELDWGAVALLRGDVPPVLEGPHVDLGCFMARREVFEQLEFRFEHGCCCLPFAADIRALGYRWGYLDERKRILEAI